MKAARLGVEPDGFCGELVDRFRADVARGARTASGARLHDCPGHFQEWRLSRQQAVVETLDPVELVASREELRAMGIRVTL